MNIMRKACMSVTLVLSAIFASTVIAAESRNMVLSGYQVAPNGYAKVKVNPSKPGYPFYLYVSGSSYNQLAQHARNNNTNTVVVNQMVNHGQSSSHDNLHKIKVNSSAGEFNAYVTTPTLQVYGELSNPPYQYGSRDGYIYMHR